MSSSSEHSFHTFGGELAGHENHGDADAGGCPGVGEDEPGYASVDVARPERPGLAERVGQRERRTGGHPLRLPVDRRHDLLGDDLPVVPSLAEEGVEPVPERGRRGLPVDPADVEVWYGLEDVDRPMPGWRCRLVVDRRHRDVPRRVGHRATAVPYRISTPASQAALAIAIGTACMPPSGK